MSSASFLYLKSFLRLLILSETNIITAINTTAIYARNPINALIINIFAIQYFILILFFLNICCYLLIEINGGYETSSYNYL